MSKSHPEQWQIHEVAERLELVGGQCVSIEDERNPQHPGFREVVNLNRQIDPKFPFGIDPEEVEQMLIRRRQVIIGQGIGCHRQTHE